MYIHQTSLSFLRIVLKPVYVFCLGLAWVTSCRQATRYDRLPGTAFPESRHFEQVQHQLVDTLPGGQRLLILVQRYSFLALREGISMPRFRKWLNQLQYGNPGLPTPTVLENLRRRKTRWFENEVVPLGLPTEQEVQEMGFQDSFSVLGRYRPYFMLKQVQRTHGGLEPFAGYRVSYHCYNFRNNRTVLLEHILHTESWPTLQRLLSHQYRTLRPTLPAEVQVPTTENFYFTNAGLIFSYNPLEIDREQNAVVELLLPWAWIYHLLREPLEITEHCARVSARAAVG